MKQHHADQPILKIEQNHQHLKIVEVKVRERIQNPNLSLKEATLHLPKAKTKTLPGPTQRAKLRILEWKQ